MSKKIVKKEQTEAPQALLAELRALIEKSRRAVTVAVNAGLTRLYWQIGKRIRQHILADQRAEYGKEIVATVSRQLTQDYGKGFGVSGLTRMIKFSEVFNDEQIVATLWQQLSWSHFRELLPLEKPLQREFYAEMCRVEGWSVRVLRQQIDSMLYERTALSRQPEAMIQEELNKLREGEQVAPALILKDPYILDFLEVQDRYIEKDLEDAILRELEAFLLELGAGFSFIARQKRLQIDGDDFYIDLLFYNRKLGRLVAIELKMGKFQTGIQRPNGVVFTLAQQTRTRVE